MFLFQKILNKIKLLINLIKVKTIRYESLFKIILVSSVLSKMYIKLQKYLEVYKC